VLVPGVSHCTILLTTRGTSAVAGVIPNRLPTA
jgi:hypothetical protein